MRGAKAAISVRTKVGGKKFEGDFSIELGILGKVHFSHASGADFLDYMVVRDHRAAGQRHIGTSLVVVRCHVPSRTSSTALGSAGYRGGTRALEKASTC